MWGKNGTLKIMEKMEQPTKITYIGHRTKFNTPN